MTRIEAIHLKARERPQCSHKIQPPTGRTDKAHWWKMREAMRDHGKDPALCSFKTTHIIDGKPYCPTHAGAEAVRILLEKT